MKDGPTTKRKIDYRQLAAMAALCAVLILVLARWVGGSPQPASPVALATATLPATQDPPAATQPLITAIAPAATPLDAGDKPIGVWQRADSDATIQIQILNWKAASASAVLYVSAGRTPFMAIYKGQVSQRSRAITTFSVVESYASTLPESYSWCRRLSGTLTPKVRADEDYLDVAPICADGTGRSIINHRGGGSTKGIIPSALLDSGAHAIELSTTGG